MALQNITHLMPNRGPDLVFDLVNFIVDGIDTFADTFQMRLNERGPHIGAVQVRLEGDLPSQQGRINHVRYLGDSFINDSIANSFPCCPVAQEPPNRKPAERDWGHSSDYWH